MSSRSLRRAAGALHRVRVGGVPEHFNTPWHTCVAKGLFHAAGLDVQWTDFAGGTGAMTRAMREGKIDIAIALTEGLVADMHNGSRTKLIGTYVSTPLTWGVHVSNSSSLQSLADLDENARYAVSRMGSGSHLMACVDAYHRGLDVGRLNYEVVGHLDGARLALQESRADVFMWEKYTTKFLVDSGEWRRIGEVPTPWPCFSIAATEQALNSSGGQLCRMLDIVREEADALVASKSYAATIGLMYGQHEADVEEWIAGVRWSCKPIVSLQTLQQIMNALVGASVLSKDQLMEPSQLLSSFTHDGDP